MYSLLLYYVIFPESCIVEGRVFHKDEAYPVFEKRTIKDYVILWAENGEFCFHKDLMEKAKKEWQLKEVKLKLNLKPARQEMAR